MGIAIHNLLGSSVFRPMSLSLLGEVTVTSGNHSFLKNVKKESPEEYWTSAHHFLYYNF